MVTRAFVTYIHILQLEEYQLSRFIKWSLNNPFGKKIENKKPLIWTKKAKFIAVVAVLWYLVIGIGVFAYLRQVALWARVLIDVALIFVTWFFISLAVITRIPYEKINRCLTIIKTRNKIKHLKSTGLKVIGITGSYGKTTTKEFLYQILKIQYRVLRTPESYNTLFGIAKVIDLELDGNYDYFICEMGAYKIGEIKEICSMVLPDYAILTGINEQHLERFKKIENTIKAKFELIQAVSDKTKCILNRDCKIILDNYHPHFPNYPNLPNSLFYGLGDFNITNPNLIGKANLTNANGAGAMAELLGVSKPKVLDALNTLKPIPHRLEVKKLDNDWIILDDAYNSNVDGFKQALGALANFKEHQKIIVTPGIVELGNESLRNKLRSIFFSEKPSRLTDKLGSSPQQVNGVFAFSKNKTIEIHQQLGSLVDKICDYAILVGKNERTETLASTITNKEKIIFIKSIKELDQTVLDLKVKNPVILIENDLTDNY